MGGGGGGGWAVFAVSDSRGFEYSRPCKSRDEMY